MSESFKGGTLTVSIFHVAPAGFTLQELVRTFNAVTNVVRSQAPNRHPVGWRAQARVNGRAFCLLPCVVRYCPVVSGPADLMGNFLRCIPTPVALWLKAVIIQTGTTLHPVTKCEPRSPWLNLDVWACCLS